MDLKKRKPDDNGVLPSSPPTIGPVPAPAPVAPPLELSPDDVRLMIDPLSSQQLAELVISATLRHLDILDEVRKFADKDPVHRKIFVRGLGWDTNTDTLKGVFSQYGELEDGIVIFDKNTGKSRGYGFITFKHMDGALNALKEPSKRIDGRMTVCQLASTGPAPSQPAQDIAARKIYVGNVPTEWPAERLLTFFSQYGEIEEGPLGFDKQTGRSRGFALFIYKSADATKRSLEEPVKLLDGHQLFCKLAVEGLKQKVGQPDGSEMPMAQTVGSAPAPPNLQYGAPPQAMAGAPYNQNTNPPMNPALNPALNPAMNPSMHPDYALPNQNYPGANPSSLHTSLPSSLTPSHGQVMNPGVSQVQTSLSMPSYGALPPYSSQVAAYGGQPGAYSGIGTPQVATYGGQPGGYSGIGAPSAMYNVSAASLASQTQLPQGQGQYGVVSYQNQQAPYHNQQQVAAPSAPHTQQTGVVPQMPYYGM